jgi:hypothetical protein
MLEKFPTGEPIYTFTNLNVSNIGFHYIFFESKNDIPVLPIKKDNKLLFANGSLEGLYWYEEIRLFLQNGGIINKIEYSIVYKKEAHIFNDFINTFNKLRELGGYTKIVGKLIINSLYGSFAMKVDNNFTIFTFSEKEFSDILNKTNVVSYTKINKCYMVEIKKDYKSNIIFNKKEKK